MFANRFLPHVGLSPWPTSGFSSSGVHVINKREEQREERKKENKMWQKTIIISLFSYNNTGYTFSSTKANKKLLRNWFLSRDISIR